MSSGSGLSNPETAIAVVGMACRFPGARSVEEFWTNLKDGVESIEELSDDELRAAGEKPELLEHPDYVKRASALSGMAHWDHGFFGMSPKEAAIMDPQHRHFLELSWEAFERAGYAPGTFGGPVGVFAGSGANTYMMFNLLSDPDLLADQGFFLLRHIGNDKDFLATRVAYHFDLQGPALNVQTACSTSLAAIHLATQSLLSFECDMALAGGVTITHPHRRGYLYREGEILSPDGHCRAFDARSGGTVLGDGAGAVVLRRYEDAVADGDTIHAVIRGSAVNNDGSSKVGYLAPSVEGQAKVVAEALAIADVDPDTIGYVEAHGTGTRLGDPIEVTALTQAFRSGTDRSGYCGIGSVKTNIGHLDTAAGVAGFIKAVLALEHGAIPASLHFQDPNPELDLEASPFRVVSEFTPWERNGAPRRAGVSSLGVGGTNVHVVLEEAPEHRPAEPSDRPRLIVLSGRSRGVVGRAGSQLVDRIESNPELDLADVAFTLQTGRATFAERRFVVASSAEELIDALVTEDPDRVRDHTGDEVRRDVAFLFAGGGAQYPGMARGLYESEEVFRNEIDRCLQRLPDELGARVRSLLFPDPGPGAPRLTADQAERPSTALPALFMVQYAQARLWMSWGITPSAMIGHSMGEYTAACLAGVFTLEEALDLVVLRGRLFERVSGGGMLGVPLSEAELRPLLGAELSVAAVNGPELCVASGPQAAIDRLSEELARREIDARRIHIDVAAHSSMLEPILEPFRSRLREARMSAPELPFASNLTGEWIRPDQATDPEYWVRQLRETVRFSEGLSELLSDPDRVLLEVGPGRTLATLARLHPARDPKQETFTSLRHPDDDVDDLTFLLDAVGRLWQHGVPIDWTALQGTDRRRRVPLPTYPFESEYHLIEPGPLPSTHRMVLAESDDVPSPGREPAGTPVVEGSGEPSRPAEWLHRIEWVPAPLQPRADRAGGPLGDHAGGWTLVLGPADRAAAAESIARKAAPDEPVRHARFGAGFQHDGTAFQLRATSKADYDRLLEIVDDEVGLPSRIVYTGALGLTDSFDAAEGRAFFALLSLGQALGERIADDPVELVVLTEGTAALEGEKPGHPAGALVAGPVRVLPAEIAGLTARWIDLPVGADLSDAATSERLAAELGSGGPGGRVALGSQGRFVPEYRALEPRGPTEASGAPLERGSVCVITGGFGGVGLEVARHLAGTLEARIALLGRTPLPDRELWDEAAARGTDPRLTRAIATIRELESRGARVLPVAVDVTDESALRSAREQIRSELGDIDAVFHAAGVLDDGLVLSKDSGAAARVLAPKVRGTRTLGRVFGERDRARLVLFSSVSAEAGLAGQIDYTSANAFLDAYARAAGGNGSDSQDPESGGGLAPVSVGWSAWRETGMAVDGARGLVHWPPLLTSSGADGAWVPSVDPRFDARDPDGHRVRVRLRQGRLWLLDEHRTHEGTPLVPGAGFVELIRAAAAELGHGMPPRFRDLYFLAPFLVPEGETRELEIRIPPDGSGEFRVLGRGRPDEEWVEHVKGRMQPAEGADESGEFAEREELSALRSRLRELGAGEWAARQDLELGPRWDNVQAMSVGTDELLLSLELSPDHADDLELHGLHPALLDNATAVAGPLLDGFGDEGSIHVPASYGTLQMHRPLPGRVWSHIRVAREAEETTDEMTVLDVTLYDDSGSVLLEARNFILVRIDASEIARVLEESREARQARSEVVSAAASRGVPTSIGLGILDLVLRDSSLPPHLLVSPEPLSDRLSELRGAAGGAGSRSTGSASGPAVDVTPVERALVAMEAVQEAAVTAHEDRPGEIRLVAHVVLDPSVFATVSELRRGLRADLPPELVPQNFVQLDALPRTARGAVKRSALADPFAPVDDHVAPETPTQEAIAEIWAELLGADRIGIHDNFLDVGGHSLLAMRAILRIEKATGVRLGPVEMNLYTLEQIAGHVDDAGGRVNGSPETASPKDTPGTEARADGSRDPERTDEAEGESGTRAGLLSAMRRLIPGA